MWSPQRVHFSDWFFQKVVLDHANPQMYQSRRTLRLRREIRFPLTFIRPFRDNPQSCPFFDTFCYIMSISWGCCNASQVASRDVTAPAGSSQAASGGSLQAATPSKLRISGSSVLVECRGEKRAPWSAKKRGRRLTVIWVTDKHGRNM